MEALAEATPNGGTRANHVYGAIKEDIISLKLKPGSLIQEEALAQQYGVSRTPVREALRRLEQEGLVKTLPKKGTLVSQLSVNDILEIFQVRMALEPLAARLAANLMPRDETLRLRDLHTPPPEAKGGFNMDHRELHRSIARHCGNERLGSILDSLFDETTRILAMSAPEAAMRFYQRHLDIVDALEERDGTRAEQMMQEHLLDFRRSLISTVIGST